MKRAAPSVEPLDVSSGDSSGSDSDQLGGKEKGGSASKPAAAGEGETSPDCLLTVDPLISLHIWVFHSRIG